MSLKADLRKRILEDMIKGSRGSEEYVVLVVDEHTAKIVSSCCRMYDIMEAGVLVLENVTKKREHLDMPAIYFIEPSKESVELMLNDFSNMKKPQYSAVHLFTSRDMPEEIMAGLTKSPIVSRMKSFKELHADFAAFESRVFLFDREKVIPRLYFQSASGLEDRTRTELNETAMQLVSVCITTREYPYIRYDSKSKYCRYLAEFVEKNLDRLVAKLPSWKPKDRGTLLIVDRKLDAVAPLMHEYTYQAMTYDVLNVNGELIELKSDKDKKGPQVLSEEDELWVEMRHKHIAEVMPEISKRFKDFSKTNSLATMETENASVDQMREAMVKLPHYQIMINRFYKHMSISQECMGEFDSQFLKELSDLEQDMATGIDSDGHKLKSSKIEQAFRRLCEDARFSKVNKLRLIMIYIISQGGVGQSRRELMKAAGISVDLQRAILNLKYLGVDVQASKKGKLSKERIKQFASRQKIIDLDLVRYVPALLDVAEAFVADQLDASAYPYTKEPPPKHDPNSNRAQANVASSRKKLGQWRHNKPDGERKEKEVEKHSSGPSFLVYVIGGMTFSEVRSIYEVVDKTKADILVGSSSMLTADKFIKEMGEFPADADLNNLAPVGDSDSSDSDSD